MRRLEKHEHKTLSLIRFHHFSNFLTLLNTTIKNHSSSLELTESLRVELERLSGTETERGMAFPPSGGVVTVVPARTRALPMTSWATPGCCWPPLAGPGP